MNTGGLDFAPRTLAWHLASARSWHWAMALLATMLLAGSLGALWRCEAQRTRTREQTLQLQEQLERRQQARVRHSGAQPALPAGQIAQVNAAVRQLNIPWTELLDALQQAQEPGVAFLELVPNAASAQLRGVAEVRGEREMLDFVRRMRKSELVLGLDLVSHEVQEQDRNKPLRFEFTLRWREP